MNKKIIALSITLASFGSLGLGIVLGYWFDSGSDRVREKVVEIPRGRVDTSTDACVKNGGVPTYSAWDGGLNGCIFVGKTSGDTNVTIQK